MEAYSQRNSFINRINIRNLRFRFTTFTKRRSVATMFFGTAYPSALFNQINNPLKNESFATHYDCFICNRTPMLYCKKNNAHSEGTSSHYNKNSSHSYPTSIYFTEDRAQYEGHSVCYRTDFAKRATHFICKIQRFV